MLLDTSFAILLAVSTLLTTMGFFIYYNVMRDIYGQLHHAKYVISHCNKHKAKYYNTAILIAYSLLCSYPFFMGTLISDAYYIHLDMILFGSICSLLFITYIQPYHIDYDHNLESYSENIFNYILDVMVNYSLLIFLVLFLTPIDLFYILVPLSAITPIVIYLWIQQIYFCYKCNVMITDYILPCLYMGIVTGATMGAYIKSML